MTQFNRKLVQESRNNSYGGILTSVETAQSTIDPSTGIDQINTVPKRTLDHSGEVVYLKGSLTNDTTISEWYLITYGYDTQYSEIILRSLHNEHTVIFAQNEIYYLPKVLSSKSLNSIPTESKTLFSRSDGLQTNFDCIKFNIETGWLVETFGIEAEFIAENI